MSYGIYSPNLETLVIRTNENLFESWLKINDIDTLVQFGKQLHSISNLDIDMTRDLHGFYNNNNRSRFLPATSARNMHSLERKLVNNWSFIGAVTGGKNLIDRFTLHLFQDERMPNSYFKIEISNKDTSVDLKYGIHIRDCPTDDAGLKTLPPFLQISNSGVNRGNNNAAGKIELPDIYTIDIKISQDISTLNTDYMLNYIVFSCPKLIYINVHQLYANYQFISSWYSTTYEDKVITHKMKDSILSSSTTKNIVKCNLTSVAISPRLFNMINNSFPNIKSLHIMNCTFTKDDQFNYHMDFSGISSLKSLELDINNSDVRSNHSHVFFQFEHIDNNGDKKYKYYCYDDNSA